MFLKSLPGYEEEEITGGEETWEPGWDRSVDKETWPIYLWRVAWCGYTQDEQEAKYDAEKADWNQIVWV